MKNSEYRCEMKLTAVFFWTLLADRRYSESKLTPPAKVASFSTELSEGRVGAPATGREILPLRPTTSVPVATLPPRGELDSTGDQREVSFFGLIL
jgi:hypothetical protein